MLESLWSRIQSQLVSALLFSFLPRKCLFQSPPDDGSQVGVSPRPEHGIRGISPVLYLVFHFVFFSLHCWLLCLLPDDETQSDIPIHLEMLHSHLVHCCFLELSAFLPLQTIEPKWVSEPDWSQVQTEAERQEWKELLRRQEVVEEAALNTAWQQYWRELEVGG